MASNTKLLVPRYKVSYKRLNRVLWVNQDFSYYNLFKFQISSRNNICIFTQPLRANALHWWKTISSIWDFLTFRWAWFQTEQVHFSNHPKSSKDKIKNGLNIFHNFNFKNSRCADLQGWLPLFHIGFSRIHQNVQSWSITQLNTNNTSLVVHRDFHEKKRLFFIDFLGMSNNRGRRDIDNWSWISVVFSVFTNQIHPQNGA